MNNDGGPGDYVSQVSQLMEKLKKLFSNVFWTKRNLLKRRSNQALDKIVEVEDALDKLKDLVSYDGVVKKTEDIQSAMHEDEALAFVSVFQANGKDLRGWEMTLLALEGSAISRPVYPDESSARQLVASKGSPLREGYVIVRVKKSDVLSMQQKDVLGQTLMTLKKNAVTVQCIERFVHFNQDLYRFTDGKLLKLETL